MPAACSFDDGILMTKPVGLNVVNDHLEWNPNIVDREARQEASGESRSESPPQVLEWEQRFNFAKHWAKHYAYGLTEYHEGRATIANEKPPKWVARDGDQYMLARANFYQAEYERLKEKDINRASRSPTAEYINPDFFCKTELDRARTSARNARCQLARFPAGKKYLDSEDYEDSEDSGKDLEFWRKDEEKWKAAYEALPKESDLERAKRKAASNSKKLATFPAGKERLETEDHRGFLEDTEYWWSKVKYYHTEHERLRQEFWDYWKPIRFGRSPSPQPLNYSITPEASIVSKPKTKIRRSSVAKRRPGSTRSTRKEKRGIQVAFTGNPNLYCGTDKMKGRRSTERRKSKEVYQGAHLGKTKPKLSPEHIPPQSPTYGLAAPRSRDSRSGRPVEEDGEVCPAQFLKVRPKPVLRSYNACTSPNSPESTSKVQKRDRHKGMTRLKRVPGSDRTYHGAKSVLQPVDPISSRLRSSRAIVS